MMFMNTADGKKTYEFFSRNIDEGLPEKNALYETLFE